MITLQSQKGYYSLSNYVIAIVASEIHARVSLAFRKKKKKEEEQ